MSLDYNTFCNLIFERYGITKEDIKDSDSFEDIGIDSLSLYSLVDEVEETYNIKIDTDDITEINTISKMHKYITKKAKQQNSCIVN